MKTQKMQLLVTAFAFAATAISCSKDGATTTPQQQLAPAKMVSVTYPLTSVTDPNISGTATLQKINNQTKVTIQLTGTTAGQMYPAHIHHNSAAEGGGIIASLSDINGASGRSVTIVSMTDGNSPLSYEDLLTIDGHINVHLSATQLSTLVAQGDIGSNF
jgi:hypothetical protein